VDFLKGAGKQYCWGKHQQWDLGLIYNFVLPITLHNLYLIIVLTDQNASFIIK
jgi:hypothetical protein